MGVFNATSTYGKGFNPTNNKPNEFYIKIYTGGFAGPKTAKKSAIKEIEEFMFDSQEFTNYRIVKKKFNWIPSFYKFIVVFEK